MIRKLVKDCFYEIQRRGARLHYTIKTAGGLPTDRFVVFNLHAICGAASDMAVSPKQLRTQLSALLQAGYHCIDLEQALKIAAGEKLLDRPVFVLTFDDGYESVYEHALPIVEDMKLTATVFLTVNFLNGSVSPPWRSNDAALLREYSSQAEFFRPLTWPQIDEMVRSGRFRVGSHSLNHDLLGLVAADRLNSELRDSKAILEDRVGAAVTTFAYPFGVKTYGAYSDRTEAAVRDAGYKSSVTSEIRSARPGSGTYLMPRISLVDRDTGADACAKASGAYDWVAIAQRSFQNIFPNPHQE